MIELRWVERPPTGTKMEDVFSGNYAPVRVLQMRQWQVRLDASGAITPLPEPITWSDWQDVPTVKEE